jgi:hypothetical protein
VTKAKSQRKHAKRRAQERYGLWLTDSQINSITQMIRTGQAVPVERQSRRVSIYDLKVARPQDLIGDNSEPVPVRVAFDYTRNEIITFLPQ